MGRPLRLLAISIVAAVTQLASLQPWQVALAETSDDEEAPTSVDIAMAAGTAAGVVEACGVDIAPIGSAFKEFLAQAKLSSPDRQYLVEKFKVAESAALSALARAGPDSCASATGVMRETVHSLTRPRS
jgi:hypothetical protein